MYQTIFKFWLNFFGFWNVGVFAQHYTPQNSCPDYFEYIDGSNGVEGQIVLKFDITGSEKI